MASSNLAVSPRRYAFRRNDLTLINGSWVRVLEMTDHPKVLEVGQITVVIDGTQVM